MITACILFILFQADSVITMTVESAAKLFTKAVSASMLADGHIAVVDQGTNSVVIVSPRNEVVSSVGGKGFGGDSFDLPTDITSSFLLDLYVADLNNRRVVRLDHRLNVVQTLREENIDRRAGSFQPTASAVTAKGDLCIVERDHKRITVFNSQGQFIRDVGTFNGSAQKLIDPVDIVVTPDDEIFVLDRHKVVNYDIFGNILSVIELEQGFEPVAISYGNRSVIVTSSDRIIVFPRDTNHQFSIQKRSLIGESVKDSFTDVMVTDSSFIIITQSSLYRCILP
ncbi:MAG: NHL repeat-containing protein [Bacteroidota bacterium]